MACKCHVHAAWSCANCQISYEYLPPVTVVAVVTVSCSANCLIWCFQLNQLKSFSPIILGLSSCYPPDCFRSHLCLLPTSILPAFFKTFRPSLCHYWHSVTTAVPLPHLSLQTLLHSIFSINVRFLPRNWHRRSSNLTWKQRLLQNSIFTYILPPSQPPYILFFFFPPNTPPKLLFIILYTAHELVWGQTLPKETNLSSPPSKGNYKACSKTISATSYSHLWCGFLHEQLVLSHLYILSPSKLQHPSPSGHRPVIQ